MTVPPDLPRRRAARGFTLIELAVVLAIVGDPRSRGGAGHVAPRRHAAGAGRAVLGVHGGAALRAGAGPARAGRPSRSARARMGRAGAGLPRARTPPTGAAAGSCSPTATGAAWWIDRLAPVARAATVAAQRRRGRHARQHQLHRRGLQPPTRRRTTCSARRPTVGARRAAGRDGVREQAGPAAPGRRGSLRLTAVAGVRRRVSGGTGRPSRSDAGSRETVHSGSPRRPLPAPGSPAPSMKPTFLSSPLVSASPKPPCAARPRGRHHADRAAGHPGHRHARCRARPVPSFMRLLARHAIAAQAEELQDAVRARAATRP